MKCRASLRGTGCSREERLRKERSKRKRAGNHGQLLRRVAIVSFLFPLCLSFSSLNILFFLLLLCLLHLRFVFHCYFPPLLNLHAFTLSLCFTSTAPFPLAVSILHFPSKRVQFWFSRFLDLSVLLFFWFLLRCFFGGRRVYPEP